MFSSRLARILLIALAAGWVFFKVVLFDAMLDSCFIFLLFALGLFGVLVTVVLLVDSLVAGIRGRGWRRMAASTVFALAAMPTSPVDDALTWTSAAWRLLLFGRTWEHEALEALALPPDAYPRSPWDRDLGPPARASLCWGGITDNWYGLIYDPSQSLDSASPEVFGGYMVQTLHVWGPWYYVSFT